MNWKEKTTCMHTYMHIHITHTRYTDLSHTHKFVHVWILPYTYHPHTEQTTHFHRCSQTHADTALNQIQLVKDTKLDQKQGYPRG